MRPKKSGGGWAAIAYTLRMANRVGWLRLWKAMRAKNACKTCALGMGGQAGGMRNELGHWPEFCKKSLQAMVADMQAGITPDFFERYSIAQLQTLSPRELESCGRLIAPVYADQGATHYRTIGWDEALARISQQLRSTQPDENFFYASGRSSNEAGFVLQLFARMYGTNFVNNCSFYCHQASGVGLTDSLGTSTATVTLEDVERADLFVLPGGNPSSNHPRLMRTLMNIRRRGGHVIVVNPGPGVDWISLRQHAQVRELIARSVPGYEGAAEIGLTKREFYVDRRVLHEPRFATASGKARFVMHSLPELRGAPNELRLMTVRSEGQFNTVVYEEEDIYRGQERRDVILMNRSDIERLGLHVDQRVTVRSVVGSLPGVLVRPFDIRAGNALMYYPEANVLVPTSVDPLSKTPAFKNVLVRLESGVFSL